MVPSHQRKFTCINRYEVQAKSHFFFIRNAVSLRNLVRLASLLEISDYSNKARETVQSFRLSLSKFPFAIPALVASFMLVSNGLKEVVHLHETSSSVEYNNKAIFLDCVGR